MKELIVLGAILLVFAGAGQAQTATETAITAEAATASYASKEMTLEDYLALECHKTDSTLISVDAVYNKGECQTEGGHIYTVNK